MSTPSIDTPSASVPPASCPTCKREAPADEWIPIGRVGSMASDISGWLHKPCDETVNL